MSLPLPTLAKLALLPDILKAAQLLYECEIIKVEPAACIRLFVKKNPDINERLRAMKP